MTDFTLDTEHLKKLVEKSKYTSAALAKECGVTPKTFGQIMSGKKKTSPAVLMLLAIRLKVPESALLR